MQPLHGITYQIDNHEGTNHAGTPKHNIIYKKHNKLGYNSIYNGESKIR